MAKETVRPTEAIPSDIAPCPLLRGSPRRCAARDDSAASSAQQRYFHPIVLLQAALGGGNVHHPVGLRQSADQA